MEGCYRRRVNTRLVWKQNYDLLEVQSEMKHSILLLLVYVALAKGLATSKQQASQRLLQMSTEKIEEALIITESPH